MFNQISLLSQVKRWAIITYKHGIYELPHELLNDLRLGKLGNIRKLSKLHRMIVSSLVSSLPSKMKVLLMLAENS